MPRRTIIVGDVHGCLGELERLLAKVGHGADDDLWFTGDLVNRGPESARVVHLVRTLGARTVLGNHDAKHLRWRRHLRQRAAHPRHPMPKEPSAFFLAVHETLGEADIDYLAAAPDLVELTEGLVLVHGGLLAGRPLDDQPMPHVLRWLHTVTGRPMTFAERDADPSRAVHWSERWPGPWRVVYGHHARPEPAIGPLTLGLDTSCVYGVALTAAVYETFDPAVPPLLVAVKATRAWWPPA
jgi:bis(5'-nucleosyl)-tetraphosphatase (symmetrical)